MNGYKWGIPLLTFLLGALMTAGMYSVLLVGRVAVLETRQVSIVETMGTYVRLTEKVVESNRQLVQELKSR